MTHWLLRPEDSLERQNEKLIRINEALMRRVEQDTDRAGAAFAMFERAAVLENQVRDRTRELERALDLLNDSNAALAAANQAAEAARNDLSNAIETVQEGFALFDAQDRLVMWNSRFGVHLLDVRERLVAGFSFDDYVFAISRSPSLQLPPDLTPDQWAKKRRARHRDRHVMFNVRLTGDRWIQVSEHRTPDHGTVVLQTDVTDIMRLEREERGKLRDTQARMMRATLDHLNQAVCIFDADGRLVGWNTRVGEMLSIPALLLQLGMSFDSLIDRVSRAFRSEKVTPQDLKAWATQPERRKPLRFEIRKPPDVTLDAFASEMPDHGFVISFTDVSAERHAARTLAEANELLERRVLERTLELEDALSAAERANASKSRFVAAASHDLLQPFSAAKLYMSVLREHPADTSAAPVADKAISALSNAEAIINALLEISKLDADTVRLDISAVSVRALLEGLRDEFQPLAQRKGLDLRVVLAEGSVISDPNYLRRILQNLIANAVRYTQTGRVLLGTRRQGDHVRFEVWDTGPGIAEADQERIFNEFERLSPDTEPAGSLGLGLAIVERACAQLGHPLGMHSTVGRGTGFMVNVARGDAVPAGAPTRSRRRRFRKLQETELMVLLVENDAELRRALGLLMERWGCTVIDVASHAEAMHLMDEIQIQPHAALVDYHLGDGPDGEAVACALRDREPDLPIRIMSANRSEDLQHRCDAAGFVLQPKPIDTGALEDFLVAAADARA